MDEERCQGKRERDIVNKCWNAVGSKENKQMCQLRLVVGQVVQKCEAEGTDGTEGTHAGSGDGWEW